MFQRKISLLYLTAKYQFDDVFKIF